MIFKIITTAILNLPNLDCKYSTLTHICDKITCREYTTSTTSQVEVHSAIPFWAKTLIKKKNFLSAIKWRLLHLDRLKNVFRFLLNRCYFDSV